MGDGEEEESYVLSERHSLSSGDKQDEEEGLLGNWKSEEPQEKDAAPPQRRRRRAFILPLALCLSALVLGTGLAFILRYISGESTEAVSTTIESNDYILDPNWDTQSPPQRREFHWTIRDQEHAPDGIIRPMILVNSQFPGPMIEANEGDTIVVHVYNRAVNATSIHWHGMYQQGTPYMDGTVGVTQCPIAPNTKFTYEFTVVNQSGTYWWHAHHGVQSSDGLHGPLIIHGREERNLQRIEYATDRVVLVSDHYHDLSSALLWQYLKPDMENSEPVPNGGLINGRSVNHCDKFPERQCDNSSIQLGYPTLYLDPGTNHRLRFINVGAFAEFQIQVDEHALAVTEVDGTDIVPKTYHRLHISPGQRYSVIITTDNTDAESFWLRAHMITQCFTNPPSDLLSEAPAVVQYGHNGSQTPNSKDWNEMVDLECKDMNVAELEPAARVRVPANPDAFFYLRSNFEIGAYRLSRGFFNTSSWRPDVHSPTLSRAVTGLNTGNASFLASQNMGNGGGVAFVNDAAFDNSRELVIQTTGVQTIDILVSNFDDGNHPLHLHGYKYFVLAQGHGYPRLTKVGADITAENLTPLYNDLDLFNPLRRDTASVEAFGWILIRFVADNPGAWAFHCHLAWHSEAGLMMQFLTRTDELARMKLPKANQRLCATPGIERGTGPDDSVYEDLAK